MIVKYLLKIAMLGSSWVMYLLLALVGRVDRRDGRAMALLPEARHGRRGARRRARATCSRQGEREKAAGAASRQPASRPRCSARRCAGRSGGPDALEAAIDGEMTKRRRELERGMTLLGTLGNNAPFVGLLGTVIGVIVAFADLADGSEQGRRWTR